MSVVPPDLLEADRLNPLIERFKRETGYPSEHDLQQRQPRQDIADALAPEHLDAAIADPGVFDMPAFRRMVAGAYGGVGNQGQINGYLASGLDAIPRLARTIRHLLYGQGDVVSRLEDVLEDPEWKVRGFGEGLATKSLAIVYPDRWVPLFVYDGQNGKRAIMGLSDLPVGPLDEERKSRGQLAKESNDVLRDLLEPYFGDDSWGAMAFLWWLKTSAEGRASSGAPATDALHLVVKWSARLRADTIDRHLEIAEGRGSVWWGLATKSEEGQISQEWADGDLVVSSDMGSVRRLPRCPRRQREGPPRSAALRRTRLGQFSALQIRLGGLGLLRGDR